MVKDLNTSEIDEFQKKLNENPDSLVFAPLADAYRKAGKLEEALRICTKGLQKHSTYTSGRVVLGRIYQEMGKREQAASELKKVLELDPDNMMAHSLLGSIYMQEKDYQAAIEEYQKILTLNPDDEGIQNSLKQAIEKAARDQKTAKPVKKDSITAEPKSSGKESTATLTIADLYFKQGHYDKAIEVYQELLVRDPQNFMLRQKLTEAIEKQQKEPTSAGVAKLKTTEFTRPPDQKEDILVIDEAKEEVKKKAKENKEDDSKFTNEDILQVMRRGGKDDVLVEGKTSRPLQKEISSSRQGASSRPVEGSGGTKLNAEQLENLKGILAELGGVDGILRCFLIGKEGNVIVSMGETGNNDDFGKQAADIFQRTYRSVSQLKQGNLNQVLVTAEIGNIFLVSVLNFILIVLANNKINLGLLRLSLDSAIKKMDKIL